MHWKGPHESNHLLPWILRVSGGCIDSLASVAIILGAGCTHSCPHSSWARSSACRYCRFYHPDLLLEITLWIVDCSMDVTELCNINHPCLLFFVLKDDFPTCSRSYLDGYSIVPMLPLAISYSRQHKLSLHTPWLVCNVYMTTASLRNLLLNIDWHHRHVSIIFIARWPTVNLLWPILCMWTYWIWSIISWIKILQNHQSNSVWTRRHIQMSHIHVHYVAILIADIITVSCNPQT